MDVSRIKSLIESAFADTQPGNIGLRQAQAMDEHRVLSEVSKAKLEDRELKWCDIPEVVLRQNQNIWGYLDDPGFKFLLPAVMVWSSENELNKNEWVVESLFYQLVSESRSPDKNPAAVIKRLSLNADQISAVAAWLEHYCDVSKVYGLSPISLSHLEEWKTGAF